jgi:hypothetical protein
MNVEPLDIRGQLVRLFTAGCIDTRRRRKPRTRSAVCGAPSSTARLSDALALVDSSAAEMTVVTVAERPDLLGPGRERGTHCPVRQPRRRAQRLLGRLTEERPEFQFYLVSDEEEVVTRAHSLPLRWDDTISDLPAGIDGAIARGLDEGEANVLCALLVTVPRDVQSRVSAPPHWRRCASSRADTGSPR